MAGDMFVLTLNSVLVYILSTVDTFLPFDGVFSFQRL